jgi:hypothetical protein
MAHKGFLHWWIFLACADRIGDKEELISLKRYGQFAAEKAPTARACVRSVASRAGEVSIDTIMKVA